MAKEFAKAFYKSSAWQRCRDGFIDYRRRIDGGVCQRCHNRLGYIVHHKQHLSAENINDVTVSLNWENLEYVCHECHNREHQFAEQLTPKCIFDDNGDVIAAM